MRQIMLNTMVAAGIAVALCAAPQAQKAEKAPKKAAASHEMTGCLQKGTEANTYTLTNVEGTGPKTVEIVGAAKGVDLSAHVGHKITITGTTVSAKKAEKAEKAKGKAEKKEEAGEHHMRVTAVKMVSATCP